MDRFCGVWTLESFIMTTCKGTIKFFPLGKKCKGTLIYTKEGMMSVQITKEKRKLFSSKNAVLGIGKKREVADTIQNYVAYSGSYNISDNIVKHNIMHHIIPNEEGKEYVRYYDFKDSKLILKTDPIKVGIFSLIGSLVWSKKNA